MRVGLATGVRVRVAVRVGVNEGPLVGVRVRVAVGPVTVVAVRVGVFAVPPEQVPAIQVLALVKMASSSTVPARRLKR